MLTLGFTEEEMLSMFKTISGILHFGNIEVKQRPREEWATIPNATGREYWCFFSPGIVCCSLFQLFLVP